MKNFDIFNESFTNNFNYIQYGKFITIYIANKSDLRNHLENLHEILPFSISPLIVSDKQFRLGRCFYRYGDFVENKKRTLTNENPAPTLANYFFKNKFITIQGKKYFFISVVSENNFRVLTKVKDIDNNFFIVKIAKKYGDEFLNLNFDKIIETEFKNLNKLFELQMIRIEPILIEKFNHYILLKEYYNGIEYKDIRVLHGIDNIQIDKLYFAQMLTNLIDEVLKYWKKGIAINDLKLMNFVLDEKSSKWNLVDFETLYFFEIEKEIELSNELNRDVRFKGVEPIKKEIMQLVYSILDYCGNFNRLLLIDNTGEKSFFLASEYFKAHNMSKIFEYLNILKNELTISSLLSFYSELKKFQNSLTENTRLSLLDRSIYFNGFLVLDNFENYCMSINCENKFNKNYTLVENSFIKDAKNYIKRKKPFYRFLQISISKKNIDTKIKEIKSELMEILVFTNESLYVNNGDILNPSIDGGSALLLLILIEIQGILKSDYIVAIIETLSYGLLSSILQKTSFEEGVIGYCYALLKATEYLENEEYVPMVVKMLSYWSYNIKIVEKKLYIADYPNSFREVSDEEFSLFLKILSKLPILIL
ncbi:hypothetical protein EI74_0352 [Mycoplasma testudineum]|uniref:RamC N-terminal domain-containing protein n=1 Tax=Mycoplasma testudineum TaxID=244584 RepID=A0A4R6IFU5_9MOLU|nr:hypothetical protein [Mycoplasma testudineum]OYD26971.1 hypothetical protein CG473_01385 [Mycoplasma testudineum]TDO20517.1 hypothetical protein EI74_0352 [Mycoplasma testudineum]